MTTAFVLSGGGSLGSVQAGMLLGLAEAGNAPDFIVGTSVGAVNGGWIALRPEVAGIAGLADVWRSLSRRDVFPIHLVVGLLGFLDQEGSDVK
jgi:NTE family protein